MCVLYIYTVAPVQILIRVIYSFALTLIMHGQHGILAEILRIWDGCSALHYALSRKTPNWIGFQVVQEEHRTLGQLVLIGDSGYVSTTARGGGGAAMGSPMQVWSFHVSRTYRIA